jgi:hypothetical protein
VLDVRIDRSLGQHQLFGDLAVPEALAHQLGDLALPLVSGSAEISSAGIGTAFLATAIASATDSSRRRPIKLVTSAGRLPFRRSGTRVVTGASVPYPPVTWTGGWGIRVS